MLINEWIEGVLEPIKNEIELIQEHLVQIDNQLREYQQKLDLDYKNRLFTVEKNTRNNNTELEKILQELTGRADKVVELEKKLDTSLIQCAKTLVEQRKKRENFDKEPYTENIKTKESTYYQIDYFDFENHFRGSREDIKKRQSIYIPFFKDKTEVIDLGCGRGEFLELMKENNINAIGVDSYSEFVEYCKLKGLNVIESDAISYIKNTTSISGIFAGQLVEHLTIEQIIELYEIIYDKLEIGGCFIIETPNPTSLAIYTHAFYIDPSHNKPIHPLTLQYIAQKAGFKEMEILYTEESKIPFCIPKLEGNTENINSFNESMKEVQNMLFGSQDYALIARK